MTLVPLQPFHPVIAEWFVSAFGEPTDVQVRAWRAIQDGKHTLIAAPTGSGKTLAALLPCLDAVVRDKLAKDTDSSSLQVDKEARGVRVLYVSPLKALNNDIFEHLVSFIESIDCAAAERDTMWPGIRCAVRTGDTPPSQRSSMAKRPPDVLMTTPESLYILLTSKSGMDMLRTVRYVVVDEIHDLAADKRGSHLSLSLERLVQLCNGAIQRIGVSATQKPMWRVARFLGGWEPDSKSKEADECDTMLADPSLERPVHPLGYVPRSVAIVESTMPKPMQVQLTMPDQTKPMTSLEAIWQPLLQRLFALMEGSRTVLIFVNSRRLCERICLRLNDAAGYELSRAHHGSLAKERRLEAERMLKSGELRCIVATSSLELGIDVGHVDLVIQIDPPFNAASGIQRIGRAGHSVGGISRGAMIVRHRGALPEAAVLSKLIADRDIEPITIPKHPLDVLSQHTVSMAAGRDWTVRELYELIVRSDSFAALPYDRLISMLQVLSGLYPFARPLLDWNRETDTITGRQSGAIAALTGAGTIPSSSAYPVHHLDSRVHLGELDEEYVHESRVGDVFQLGTNSWMIRRIDRDRIYVTEAPNSFSEIPFWRNEADGRSVELGLKIGQFIREAAERLKLRDGSGEVSSADDDDPLVDRSVTDWLVDSYGLDGASAETLVAYIRAQHAFCGLPTDRTIIVEHYRDVSNQTHVIVHNWFGRRLNRTWLLAIERQFEQLLPYKLYGNAKDNGIEFVLPDWDSSWLQSIWHVMPGNVTTLLTEAVTGSPLLAIAFRHLAETSLLLSRSFNRTPLWQKRLRSEELLREAMPYAERFPFLDEAMRECLHRYLDVDGLRGILEAIGNGQLEFVIRETQYPSPMATQFIAEYVNMRIYEGDGLDDVIRMQLLNVSKELAGKVFGDDAIRSALSVKVIEAERERLSNTDGRLSSSDDLLSWLKIRGDMGTDEIVKLGGEAALAWVAELSSRGAIVLVDLSDLNTIKLTAVSESDSVSETVVPTSAERTLRWICRDEQELYSQFPHDPASVSFIIGRFAEHQISFTEPELCERYPALTLKAAREAVALLLDQQLIEQAPFASGPDERLWTGRRTAERLIRLSIHEARDRIKPAHPNRWFVQMAMRQHVLSGTQLRGEEGLRTIISRLQGLFLPLSHWETIIFPSRMIDYRPELLDLLCATGDVIWLGKQDNGEKEGRIAFFLADSKPLYEPYVSALDTKPSLRPDLLAALRSGGASFLAKLARDIGEAPSGTLNGLLSLVWEGQASNDQFAPLRLHASKKKSDWARSGSGLGRWYWTGSLSDNSDSSGASQTSKRDETEAQVQRSEAHSALSNATESSAIHWVRHLLDSCGIVTKELVSQLTPFSWDALLPVLKQLEEWGTITRGKFVDGEAAMQFTTPDIAEAIRSPVPDSQDRSVTVLSSIDPANPYGLIAPWPKLERCSFARKAGHYLVLCGGEWLYWIENNGRRIHTISGEAAVMDSSLLELRLSLSAILRRQRLSKIVVELWNGSSILSTDQGVELLGIGAERDGQRLVFWPSTLT
ncbi:DEAD/DEAH box helicase [Paenibacillus xylaniclasticus]|uniref:DEAD/DEAH box helicase n=1 Tax=Paenibacillus xylaniclasticus TaxID=588083 RepID=UPI000FD9A923|nr:MULTISPECIES: DEAD/DEAH box helicase [Paenibacillus]GFN32318.1 ATP-dependent DNA helicase [Paenibacillus curdlanolyticus]